MDDRIPLYLAVMLIALAQMTTNVYNVHTWNLGIVTLEPWRQKLSSGVARVAGVFARCVDFVWPHRQQIAAVTCALLMLLLAPHTSVAFIGVAGTVAQLEADLQAKKVAAKTLLETTMQACADHVVTPASADGKTPAVTGRLMTDEEKGKVQAILDEAKAIQKRIDATKNDAAMLGQLETLTAGMTAGGSHGPARVPGRGVRLNSLGQAFIDSETYAWIKKTNGQRTTGWSSPASELPGLDMYSATLTTDPASGGDLVVPDFRPGIVDLRFRDLVVADLVAPGTTESNLISFMKETTATNAAATVAEGAAKPESTLIFDAASAPVRKIATWLPVTDEMLEDVPAIRSFVDQRLRLFVQLVEDDQLLNGDGIAPNILGLRNQAGMQADLARGADTNVDALRKQITLIAINSFLQPDGIVLHPTNWQTIELSKDANGQYYGMGPFATPGPRRLWGLPVAVTLAMTAGVGLPGAFRQGAQFFRKGGLRVDTSNSHNDFFVKNLTAIRAEERGALAVYRPGAFGEVTGLN